MGARRRIAWIDVYSRESGELLWSIKSTPGRAPGMLAALQHGRDAERYEYNLRRDEDEPAGSLGDLACSSD